MTFPGPEPQRRWQPGPGPAGRQPGKGPGAELEFFLEEQPGAADPPRLRHKLRFRLNEVVPNTGCGRQTKFKEYLGKKYLIFVEEKLTLKIMVTPGEIRSLVVTTLI
jgi:hypothetical protein